MVSERDVSQTREQFARQQQVLVEQKKRLGLISEKRIPYTPRQTRETGRQIDVQSGRISQALDKYEKEIARKLPQFSKPSYLEAAYQEAQQKIKTKVDALRNDLKKKQERYKQRYERMDSEDRDDARDEMRAVELELSGYEGYVNNPDKVNTVGKWFSGEIKARANYKVDRFEAKERFKELKKRYSQKIEAVGKSKTYTEYAKKYAALPDDLQKMYTPPASSKVQGYYQSIEKFKADVKKLQSELPQGEKLVVDWDKYQVKGIESGALGQSMSIENYNKTIQDIQKPGIDPVSGLEYGQSYIEPAPSTSERLGSYYEDKPPIAGTLSLISGETKRFLDKFQRDQRQKLGYMGGAQTKYDALLSELGGITIGAAPFFTPASPYLLTGLGVERFGTEKGREMMAAETEYLKEEGFPGWFAASAPPLLSTGEILLGTSGFWLPKVKGYAATRGRTEIPVEQLVPEEVISGKKTFPTAPPRKHLSMFKQQGTAYHAYPEEWQQYITGPGSSELPGTYVSSYVSPHFLKVGGTGSSYPGTSWFDKFVEASWGSLWQSGGKPGVMEIQPGGFRKGRWVKTSPYKINGQTFHYKWVSEGKPGIIEVPGMKTEIEGVIRPDTTLVKGGGTSYFKWRGQRIPIDEFSILDASLTGGKLTGLPSGTASSFASGYSPYYLPQTSSFGKDFVSAFLYGSTSDSKKGSSSKSQSTSSAKSSLLSVSSGVVSSLISPTSLRRSRGYSYKPYSRPSRRRVSRPSFSLIPEYSRPGVPRRPRTPPAIPRKVPPDPSRWLRSQKPKYRKPSVKKKKKKPTSFVVAPTAFDILAPVGPYRKRKGKKKRKGAIKPAWEITGLEIKRFW